MLHNRCMTLEKYARLLDKILMYEASWVTAEKGYIKVFVKKPVWVETARNVFEWKGSGGQYPVLIIRFRDGDLDLEEYTDKYGHIDWSACRVQI